MTGESGVDVELRFSSKLEPSSAREHKRAVGNSRHVLESQRFQCVHVLSNKARGFPCLTRAVRYELIRPNSRGVCVCVCTTQLTLLPSTFTTFNGKKTTMLQGDFFLLDAAAAGGPVDRVWDRGSLVAIEPSLRER